MLPAHAMWGVACNEAQPAAASTVRHAAVSGKLVPPGTCALPSTAPLLPDCIESLFQHVLLACKPFVCHCLTSCTMLPPTLGALYASRYF